MNEMPRDFQTAVLACVAGLARIVVHRRIKMNSCCQNGGAGQIISHAVTDLCHHIGAGGGDDHQISITGQADMPHFGFIGEGE